VGAGFSAFLFGGIDPGEPAPTVRWHRSGRQIPYSCGGFTPYK